LLILARYELLKAHDMIPFECRAFLPTERTLVAVSFQQLGLLFACEVQPAFSTLDQEQ
jgi:hypothetical protein